MNSYSTGEQFQKQRKKRDEHDLVLERNEKLETEEGEKWKKKRQGRWTTKNLQNPPASCVRLNRRYFSPAICVGFFISNCPQFYLINQQAI